MLRLHLLMHEPEHIELIRFVLTPLVRDKLKKKQLKTRTNISFYLDNDND